MRHKKQTIKDANFQVQNEVQTIPILMNKALPNTIPNFSESSSFSYSRNQSI